MARPKTYVVSLSDAQREQLHALIAKGRESARTIRRAHTLLLADEGHSNQAIARMLHLTETTVHHTNRRFVAEGLDAALYDRPRPGAERKLDGRGEAHLIALACSTPPEGHACWSLRLLAERIVQLKIVESISHETVRQTLKKTRSNRG